MSGGSEECGEDLLGEEGRPYIQQSYTLGEALRSRLYIPQEKEPPFAQSLYCAKDRSLRSIRRSRMLAMNLNQCTIAISFRTLQPILICLEWQFSVSEGRHLTLVRTLRCDGVASPKICLRSQSGSPGLIIDDRLSPRGLGRSFAAPGSGILVSQ
jgi:hypothetical protein